MIHFLLSLLLLEEMCYKARHWLIMGHWVHWYIHTFYRNSSERAVRKASLFCIAVAVMVIPAAELLSDRYQLSDTGDHLSSLLERDPDPEIREMSLKVMTYLQSQLKLGLESCATKSWPSILPTINIPSHSGSAGVWYRNKASKAGLTRWRRDSKAVLTQRFLGMLVNIAVI